MLVGRMTVAAGYDNAPIVCPCYQFHTPLSDLYFLVLCGKWETVPREFAKCRRCRKAKYCGKECQSTAWSEGHRFWCSAREENEEGEEPVAGQQPERGPDRSSTHRIRHHHVPEGRQLGRIPQTWAGGIPIGDNEVPMPIIMGTGTVRPRERERTGTVTVRNREGTARGERVYFRALCLARGVIMICSGRDRGIRELAVEGIRLFYILFGIYHR